MSMERSARSHDFWQGFRSGAPLWVAAIPFALAYVVSARQAGFSAAEMQWMSLAFNAAATQLAVVQQVSLHSSWVSLLFIVFLMNLHHFFYGASLLGKIRPTLPQRALLAFGLTDYVNGMVVSRAGVTIGWVLGLEASIYLAWNVNTVIAILLGNWLALLGNLRLDFIAPLTFFLLLVGLVKTRVDIAVAAASALLALLLQETGWGAYTLPVVSVVGSALGVLLVRMARKGGAQ